MEFGYFSMPSHPPERGLKAGHDFDLQTLRWLDEFGYTEAWIGEHHTAPWEPHPAPDLLVAQALLQTKRIRLGPGGFLLPYHHPAELANRVAMLDHLSQGRLNFGIAASGLPSDWAMFNVDGMSGTNRDMTREALEIILRLWTEDAPFHHEGKFWKVDKPDTMFGFLKPHLKPLQAPHPPIGVAGLSKNSDTLKLAGERGFLPMSLNLNPAYVASHWDSVEAGARRGRPHARPPRLAPGARGLRRRDRRGGVAAFGRLHDGPDDGRVLPATARQFRLPRIPEAQPRGARQRRDGRSTARSHNWLVGSPATVAEKLEKVYEDVGGFGQILVFGFDYAENPEAWRTSLGMLQEEVAPRLKHLVPKESLAPAVIVA